MDKNSMHVLITGTGSLASSVLHQLARASVSPVRLTIASRDSGRLQWLTRSARALAPGSGATIESVSFNWDDRDSLKAGLRRMRPDLVLHCASFQSPWALSGGDAWARLVAAAGFGFTLPLQLVLAKRLGEAIDSVVPDAMYINACYPDAVNPMLRAAGLPVFCGVGNVAILAALLRADLGIADDEVRLIAHHSHLSAASPAPASAKCLSTFRAWRREENWDDSAQHWLKGAALPADQRLNTITANTISVLIGALLGISAPVRTHAPGPDGLPGGYPVLLEAGKLSLNLPPGITKQAAVEFNRSASAFDGVTIETGGNAVFSTNRESLVHEILGVDKDLIRPMSVHSVEDRAARLLAVRESLSTTPQS